MKKYPISFIIFTLLLVIVSCKKTNKESKKFEAIDQLNWLIGEWENKLDEGTVSESWQRTTDSTFIGHSYFIKTKDTLHSESIELIQNGEQLFYNSTVKGQNSDNAEKLKLTSESKNQLVFENAQLDYPQKIVYKLISIDSLIVTISGKQQGKQSIESYPMKKK